MGNSGITIFIDPRQFQKRTEIYFGKSTVWSIYIGNSGVTILAGQKQFRKRNEIYFRNSSVWSIYIGISGITIMIDAKQFQKWTEMYFRSSPFWSIYMGKSGIGNFVKHQFLVYLLKDCVFFKGISDFFGYFWTFCVASIPRIFT